MKISVNTGAALLLPLLLLLPFAPASTSATETTPSFRGAIEIQGEGQGGGGGEGKQTKSNLRGNDRKLKPDNMPNDGDVIEGSYIFVLRQDVSDVRGVISALTKDNPGLGPPVHVYENSIKGFSADNLPPGLAKQLLDSSTDIAYIEENRVISIDAKGGNGKGRGKPAPEPDPAPDPEPEPDPEPALPPPPPPPPSSQEIPYGITRVNPGGATYTGSSVAWVIDTGIQLNHTDLNVDPAFFFDFYGVTGDDGHGHGTHVAGTIAAINNDRGVVGVAAGAPVIPVKVLSDSGSGTTSTVIAGVNHVGANGSKGDVANMSLGGGFSQALNDAVVAASANGVKFVVAAGNSNADANNYSPASASAEGPNIYTVSAIDSKDNFAYFSNYGSVVDWAAPGVNIKSTWKGGGYNTISGTSMAAPHVAGVLLVNGANGCTVGGYASLLDSQGISRDLDGNPDPICVIPNP